jgi:crossover junction endodeoxyribonuclease RuvC
MTVLGIDPGAKGAFVLNTGGELDVLDMPTFEKPVRRAGKIIKRRMLDEHAIARWLAEQDGSIDAAYIEGVNTRPGESGSSAFAFGVNYGLVRGILVGMDIGYEVVASTTWTKALAVGADKSLHRRQAQMIWPAQADLFKRVKDDGRADAALITAWAARL